MTIWLLALILLASLAGIGYRQGAIRVAFSLVGIIFAALLAAPLAKAVVPALKALGIISPFVLWWLGPFIVFCAVLSIFKIGGLAVHKKVDVYYKYKAGDLRLALFERINARLGMCLGLANGLFYLIALAFIIHAYSYWTIQISTANQDSKWVRLCNQMGRDLQSTGMIKVAGAVSRLSPTFYDAADLAGLLFHNPLLEARLSRYPGFISLGLKQEFQTLGADAEFSNLRLQQRPLQEILNHPSMAAIKGNPDMLREIWNTAKPDLKDLNSFLHTGKSEKYDSEPILGRWMFDPAATVLALRRDKPRLPQTELIKFKRILVERFSRIIMIAAPTGQMVLRNVPQFRPVQPGVPFNPNDVQNLDGKWTKNGDGYEISISGADGKQVRIENGRLSYPIESFTIVFARED